jgi:CDP-glucose 4,6-dehydratase
VKDLFANTFTGRTVLVTGHTGFKGSWLTTWLLELGANVVGYSLPNPPTEPSNFVVAGLQKHVIDVRGDVRDLAHVRQTIEVHKPEVVFHLAAQPIVLRSFAEPHLTIETNALGTLNVLEAIRTTETVRALVSITTDKVYENREWVFGYREIDRLGGDDPYSAGKAMAELALASYRHSYFPPERYGEHRTGIASVRAGNVIGGGDFAPYRLVPDCMRALLANEPILIRNPESIRPWQHVLEPLGGYLSVAAKLLSEGPGFAQAWNFGPGEKSGITTRAIAERLIALWGSGSWSHVNPDLPKGETRRLGLSWDKAAVYLGWRPVFTWDETLAEIVDWFKAYQKNEDMLTVCRDHLRRYVTRAREQELAWTC